MSARARQRDIERHQAEGMRDEVAWVLGPGGWPSCGSVLVMPLVACLRYVDLSLAMQARQVRTASPPEPGKPAL
jgi:hypothetical protein